MDEADILMPLYLSVSVLLSLSVVVVVMDLFALTTLTPIVGMLTLGVTHSTAAATIWPSIALLVPLRVVGSGVAVMSSIQMFGVALWNGFAGLAVDGPGYTAMVCWSVAWFAALPHSINVPADHPIHVHGLDGSRHDDCARNLRRAIRWWSAGVAPHGQERQGGVGGGAARSGADQRAHSSAYRLTSSSDNIARE